VCAPLRLRLSLSLSYYLSLSSSVSLSLSLFLSLKALLYLSVARLVRKGRQLSLEESETTQLSLFSLSLSLSLSLSSLFLGRIAPRLAWVKIVVILLFRLASTRRYRTCTDSLLLPELFHPVRLGSFTRQCLSVLVSLFPVAWPVVLSAPFHRDTLGCFAFRFRVTIRYGIRYGNGMETILIRYRTFPLRWAITETKLQLPVA
jgi:hypothetical protein